MPFAGLQLLGTDWVCLALIAKFCADGLLLDRTAFAARSCGPWLLTYTLRVTVNVPVSIVVIVNHI